MSKRKVAGLLASALLVPFLPLESRAFPGSNTSLPSASSISSAIPLTPGVVSPAKSPNTVAFLLKMALFLGGSAGIATLLAAFLFRRVVTTNTVHIVQSGSKTVAYGSNLKGGNVYYEIPTWVPKFGVSVIKLPVNNFDLSLQNYEAYDEDRVPFVVDVTAFFRIYDPTVAAQRIANVKELQHQLQLIVQGAVRKVLASYKIHDIMTQRSALGMSFSQEVQEQLVEWGVESVKNMELMDLRDAQGSKVIANIMAMKSSEIERDSRITVSENNRLAQVAEVENKRTAEISAVEAEREISLSREIASQQVGEREAEKQKAVGIAQEQSKQLVLAQQAETKEKDLQVRRVEEIRLAEISRDSAVIQAEQEQKVASVNKATALIQAQQQKETTVLVAEGKLEAEKKEAEAVQAKGMAEAEAQKALELAPVTAQITLAKEIGSNESYQKYLALIEAYRAFIAVGTEQAKALQEADVKVIASGGSAQEGVKGVGELFSPKGGTSMAAAVEAFAQSDVGANILSKIINPSA